MLLHSPNAELGSQWIDFELADPRGNKSTLQNLKGEKGTLIAFICNHCPYVKAIVERMVEDAKTLQKGGVEFIAICPNDYISHPEDSPENMQKFAAQHGFTFKYLVDEDQSVAKAYGAVCTPDFFGYNAEGTLQYRGRLDDAKMMRDSSNRVPELVQAMQLVAETGKGPEEQHASMGCSIKWKE